MENLEKIYDIAKMIAPTVVFFDEGASLAPKRSQSGGQLSDKLTNKFLNIIDGEIPLRKVFTVLTTNRIDIMDPVLIGSKRLKVMETSGYLRQEDIIEIKKKGLDIKKSVESAHGICNTPADYTAFIDKALSLRKTELAVLIKIRKFADENDEKKFCKIEF